MQNLKRLFQKAYDLFHVKHKELTALTIFYQIVTEYPNSPEAELSKKEIEIIEQHLKKNRSDDNLKEQLELVNSDNADNSEEDWKKEISIAIDKVSLELNMHRIGLGAVFSVILPGLGHIYAGNIGSGICRMFLWFLLLAINLGISSNNGFDYSGGNFFVTLMMIIFWVYNIYKVAHIYKH
jgi:hypothetical protein